MADAKIITYGEAMGSGANVIADNLSPSLLVESVDDKDYIEIDTTDSAEKLTLAGGGATIELGSASSKTATGGAATMGAEGGSLTISTGDSTETAGHADADELVIESDGNSGVNIISGSGSGTTNYGALLFGRKDGEWRGGLNYQHGSANDYLQFWTAGTLALKIDKDNKIMTGGETTSLGLEGGSLHIMTGNSGGTTESGWDDLVVERTAGAAMTFLSNDAADTNQTSGISFRRASNNSHLIASNKDASNKLHLYFRCMQSDAAHSFIFRPNADTTALTMTGAESTFQDHDVVLQANSTSTGDAADKIIFHKSNNATDGSHTIVADNDVLGTVEWKGSDGNSFAPGAKIFARVNGTPGDGDMPTELVFATSADGAEAPSERVHIANNGWVGINTASPANRFHVETSANEGLAKFAQTGDNQATCFVLSSASTDRGPAYFTATSGSFNDSATYPIVRVIAEASESSNIGMIGCYTSGGSEPQFLVKGDGSVSAGTSYAVVHSDYAEYFETTDGGSIAVGSSVVLEGGKVRAAQAGENPIGVIRPNGTSSVVGNDPWNHWKYRYLRDDFGAYLREAYTITEWTDDYGEFQSYATDGIPDDAIPPDDATISSTDKSGEPWMRKVENPDYDDSLEYVKREDRDEWVIVGLMGQVPISKGQPLADSWVKMRDVSDSVEFYFIK